MSPNDTRPPRVGAGDQLERRRRARHQEIPVGAALHHIVTLELHEVEHRGLEVPQVDHRQRLARESIWRLHRHLDDQRLGGLRGHSAADGEILRGSSVVVIDRGLTADRGRVEQADAQQRRELEHRPAPTVFYHVALEGDATLRGDHHSHIGACDARAEAVHAHGQAAGTTRGRAINLDLQATAGTLVEVGATLQLDEAADLHAQVAAQLVLTHLEIRHLDGGHHTADLRGVGGQPAGRLPDLDDSAGIEDVIGRLEDELARPKDTPVVVAEQLDRRLRHHRVAQAHIPDLDISLTVVGPLRLSEHQLVVLISETIGKTHRAAGCAAIAQQGVAGADDRPRIGVPARGRRTVGAIQFVGARIPFPDVAISPGGQRHRGGGGRRLHRQDETRTRAGGVEVLRGEITIHSVGSRVGRRRTRASGHGDPSPTTESDEDLVACTGDESAFDIRGHKGPGVLAAVCYVLRLAEIKHTIEVGQPIDLHQDMPHASRFAEEVVSEAHADLVLAGEIFDVEADLAVTGARDSHGPQRDGLAARIARIVSFDQVVGQVTITEETRGRFELAGDATE